MDSAPRPGWGLEAEEEEEGESSGWECLQLRIQTKVLIAGGQDLTMDRCSSHSPLLQCRCSILRGCRGRSSRHHADSPAGGQSIVRISRTSSLLFLSFLFRPKQMKTE